MATVSPRKRRAYLGIGALLLVTNLNSAVSAGPDWLAWTPAVFSQAARENRLVLLDITAEWCTACRTMDEITFRDPRVLDILRHHYLPVRSDIERDPEIARHYGVLGVPAVIVLDAQGNEIMQRSGYLEPDWLYWMLVAVADDPSPESHR